MNCIDLTSKRSKMFSYVAKLQKWSNYSEFHRFDIKTIKKRKTTKDLFRWICIDLTWKRSKQHKTTKVIKLQWIASIWHQNDQKCWVTSQNIQNYAKYESIISNYNQKILIWCQNIKPTQNYKSDLISMNLHRFDIKTIKTTQIYESHQIIMNCIDLTSKRSKKLSYVAMHSKQPKLQK